MLSNRTAIQKLDLALSDLSSGGLLPEAHAAAFMQIMIDESVLLKQATVLPMKSFKQQIDKIRFANRVLRPGKENAALAVGDRVKPNLSKVELDAKLFKAECRISDETLEDNIEGEELKQTVMQLLGEAIGRDMEEVAIQGDTTSADTFLAQMDGFLKLAVSNVVAAGSARLNKTVLRDMIRAMPTPFLRNKAALRFFASIDAEADYRDSIADRGTILGDKSLETDMQARYSGVPVQGVALIPGDGTGSSKALLTDPKNMQLGIWRNIKVKQGELIQEGEQVVVTTIRFDVAFAEETAVVKSTGILV